MRRMTLDEWLRTSPDSRGLNSEHGAPQVLNIHRPSGATILEPVELVDSTITYHYRMRTSGFGQYYEVVGVIEANGRPEAVEHAAWAETPEAAQEIIRRMNGCELAREGA